MTWLHIAVAGKRNPIMVKMVPLGDHLLLHWMAPQSFKEPRLLNLFVPDCVNDADPSATDGTPLSGLLQAFLPKNSFMPTCSHSSWQETKTCLEHSFFLGTQAITLSAVQILQLDTRTCQAWWQS